MSTKSTAFKLDINRKSNVVAIVVAQVAPQLFKYTSAMIFRKCLFFHTAVFVQLNLFAKVTLHFFRRYSITSRFWRFLFFRIAPFVRRNLWSESSCNVKEREKNYDPSGRDAYGDANGHVCFKMNRAHVDHWCSQWRAAGVERGSTFGNCSNSVPSVSTDRICRDQQPRRATRRMFLQSCDRGQLSY